MVVLLLAGVALTAPVCPTVKCMKVINESYCIDAVETPIKIYDCPANKYCDRAKHQCVDMPTPQPPANVPVGNKADKDEYCFTKKRDAKGYCAGEALNAACKTLECGANTRCNGTFCIALLKDGDACTYSAECVPASGCHEKKCTPRYTIAAGTAVTEESMCISGHLFEGKCVDTTKTPIPEWFSNTTDPTKACKYDGDRMEAGVCLSMGDDANAAGMCREFAGAYVQASADMKKYWAATINFCPITNPFCDLGLDSIDACVARKTLEGMQFMNKKMATKTASCLPSPIDKRFEKYKCFSSSLVMGLLTFLAIIFLL